MSPLYLPIQALLLVQLLTLPGGDGQGDGQQPKRKRPRPPWYRTRPRTGEHPARTWVPRSTFYKQRFPLSQSWS